jgi:hypothetical protein
MKKIVIVGHPQSGYQDVEALLNACGMTAARPSRREGFSPVEIGSILTRSHAIPATGQLDDSQAIEQIEPSPVWHGIALDLMLGNLDQDVWGWADPQAISLLNYWRDLDPQITFMLVYDKPHSVLTRLKPDEAASLSKDVLRKRIDNWVGYNEALLHFFHRNPQRCLLVHGEQVRESVGSYLQQVRARIDAPWSEQMEQLLALESSKTASSEIWGAGVALAAESVNVTQRSMLKMFSTSDRAPQDVLSENALALFLADALVQQNCNGLQVYEELQAVANLPLAVDTNPACDPMQAWLAMAAQEQQLNMSETLLAQLHQVQEALEREFIERQHQQQKIQALLQDEQLAAKKNEELSEAKSRADKQAHELGEQLERVRQQLAAANEQAKTQTLELKAKLEAAEAKAAAPGSTLVNSNSAVEQENELLLAQLHQVQEELERFYLENQKLKVEMAKMPKPEPMRYGAANLVKQQLPYRLGATLVQRSRSLTGWLGMPAALAREARQFRRENPQGTNGASLPVESYADAHEAIKVKQHLSYRLGVTLVANSDSPVGWVKLPWVLLREIRQYRTQRKTSAGAYNTYQNRTSAPTR